jgi:ubiquinone biosynthesis protein
MADTTRSQRSADRHSERARSERILAVFSHHGFELLDQTVLHHGANDQTRAVQLREALEELGTIFIKLGQFVASQSVALPKPYQVELAKLDGNVPPVPASVIRAGIAAHLGHDVDQLFTSFSDTPLGTASIGQVHAATLADGREVVVKVKKPGVDTVVAADLALLDRWVKRMTPHVQFLQDMHATELLPEFTRVLKAELDYGAEAANIGFFAKFFSGDTRIQVPQIIDDRTAGDVICETRLVGTSVLAVPPPGASADTSTRLTHDIIRLVLEPGLTAGTFHADPHAGNLLVTDDGQLGVLDFGKVGRLTTADRQHMITLFLAVGSRDADRLTRALLTLADVAQPVDQHRLRADVQELLHRYVDTAVGGISVEAGLDDLVTLVASYGLSFPGRVVLFFKALAMSEGLITSIDPQARLDRILVPALRRIVVERLLHGQAAAGIASWAVEAAEAVADLPARAGQVFAAVMDGRVQVTARVEDLPGTVSRLEGMVDRLTAAVLVAAGIIGTAVVLEAYRPTLPGGIGGLPWLLAGVVLTFFVRAVSRRTRRRRARKK